MRDDMILDRYRPLGQIGAGGFGSVALAWDTRIQRKVAVKCMEFDQELIDAAVAGAGATSLLMEQVEGGGVPAYGAAEVPGLEEARTAALLSDPHIVGVLDFEVQGTTAYLIMEYVDGITLGQLMERFDDQMTPDVAAAVFSDVAHALSFAHENQVLHLDVKPDNVLINHQGQVKVTDFGLSSLSSAAGFGHAQGGTIGYMPPEQMNRDDLDERCDEWALASMTYEMLSGANPFLARDLKGARAAIEDAELVLPSLCMSGIDAAADDVLFYALDPDRDERYDTVADFAEELLPCLGSVSAGRRQLRRIVGAAEDDSGEGADALREVPRMDLASDAAKRAAMRIWAAASCGALAFCGASNVSWIAGGLDSLAFWGLLAGVVALGAWMPAAGALAAAACFTAAMASQGALLAAVVFASASLAWWFASGRKGAARACSGLAPALFGGFGCASVAPLACGYFLRVRPALASALYAGVLAVYLAALGSMSLSGWWMNMYWDHMGMSFEQTLLLVLRQPTTWITLASWVVSAAAVAACCAKRSRVAGVMGMVLGGALLAAGTVACAFYSSAGRSLVPDAAAIAAFLVPFAVGLVFAVSGIPERG